MPRKVAVVTGANRGMGFAVVKALCQQFDGIVYLTARDETKVKDAVAKLNALGLKPAHHVLDVTKRDSIEKFRDYLKSKYRTFDLLINNAGVLGKIEPDYDDAIEVININYRSVLRIGEILYPILSNDARVINISSFWFHLTNIRVEKWRKFLSNKNLTVDDIEIYIQNYLTSVKNGTFKKSDYFDDSKFINYKVAGIATTALTFIQQKQLSHTNIAVNTMDPGYVATDMTKGHGDITADQAAKVHIHLALIMPQSFKGKLLWNDLSVVDWYDETKNYCVAHDDTF